MKKLFVLFLLMGMLLSCSDDEASYQAISKLDSDLELALFNASNQIGISYYKLPNSTRLERIPQDPNNPLTPEKVHLGQLLFHETALAVNPSQTEGEGTYSCASCHHVKAGFQAGMRQGIGEGGIGFGFAGESRTIHANYTNATVDVQPIKSPSVLNVAYQKVMLWNGQFGAKGINEGTEVNWTIGTPKETNNLGYEGVETQAIAGLTVHRMDMNETIANNLTYKMYFDLAFPNVSISERYSLENAGLAIAAYERTLVANQAPFQQWLNGNLTALSDDEKRGAILFFDKAACYTCHNGPSLALMEFAALGMNDLVGGDILGAIVDDATRKGRGGFTQNPNDNYKFKVPQLYNLKSNGSYGHGASFNSVKAIIKYKNEAIKENPIVPSSALHTDFVPLNLNETEIDQLTLFIEKSLHDTNLTRYVPESVLSGNCFPNNDSESQQDLGCN